MTQPLDTTPRWGEVGIHGLQRPPRWDAVVLAGAGGLDGDELRFAVTPDGTVYDDGADPAPWLRPLAAALLERLPAPVRAHAVRRGPDRWAVGGNRVEAVALADDPGGSELELTAHGGPPQLRIDGIPSFRAVPELERLAGSRNRSYVAVATRLGGAYWELRVHPL